MFNRKILSGIVTGSLLVATLPASAQLLGGGITGAAGGALDAQMGRVGVGGAMSGAGQGSFGTQDSLAGARNGLGRVRGATRDAADNGAAAGKSQAQASKGQLAGAADASQTAGASVAKSSQATGESAAQKPQPQLIGGAATNAGAEGAFERKVAGRRASAHGSSSNHVAGDDSGLSLGSANDAGASFEKVEQPPAEPAPADDRK